MKKGEDRSGVRGMYRILEGGSGKGMGLGQVAKLCLVLAQREKCPTV